VQIHGHAGKLRVLMVHNRYRIRGGEDESTRSEVAMLRAHGHDVFEYVKDNDAEAHMGGVGSALRCIWSRSDYGALRDHIRKFRPDVMHVQNFFPLISPAAYYAAARENIPVVQSLRNFRLLCPAATMFREGVPCYTCIRTGSTLPAIAHACYRGSRTATAAVASMTALHRLARTWSRRVTVYIAISEFMRSTFVSAGFDNAKFEVKANFVDTDPGIGRGDGGYILYAGRLCAEKGIGALIQAWNSSNFDVPLHIVGDGPMLPQVEEFAKLHPQVRYLGKVMPQDVLRYMGDAAAVVVPSAWDEPFGRTVVEAFAKGTPVIASSTGALPELVRDQETGFLFDAANGKSLADTIRHFLHVRGTWGRMRQSARTEFETKYTAEVNYPQLWSIYQRAIGEMRAG
jgi:glycosyltransferase involved in cell wall biosynthesis